MITIDTNNYISGLQYRGNPSVLLHRAIEGDVGVAISEPILWEVLRVLRDKFGRSEEDVARFEEVIRGFRPHGRPDANP